MNISSRVLYLSFISLDGLIETALVYSTFWLKRIVLEDAHMCNCKTRRVKSEVVSPETDNIFVRHRNIVRKFKEISKVQYSAILTTCKPFYVGFLSRKRYRFQCHSLYQTIL